MAEKYDNSRFYSAQERWLNDNNDQEAWHQMWEGVYGACSSTMKKFARKCPGIHIDDLEGLALDTAAAIMNRYLKPKGLKIENLSNYVHMPCFGVLYHPKRKFADTCASFEYEDSKEESYNEVYGSFEDDIIERLSAEGY